MSQLIHTFEYAFAIITLLGGVIAVHEFGHFIFAKWCGIRVDTFSIGFGPKLFARKYGETEYVLSLVPLGGFVKIYGQDPEELTTDANPQPERAFVKKSLMEKISVLFGGPLFNYLLAILIFAFLAVVGVQKLPSVATRVVNDTPAFKAGLRSGDVIVSVNGTATKTFDEVVDVIAKSPEKTIPFSLLRNSSPLTLNIQVQKEHALTPYGEESIAGVLEGLEPLAREPIAGVSAATHPYGFQNGDRILEIQGTKIDSWEEMETKLEKIIGQPLTELVFKVQRGNSTLELKVPGSIVTLLPKNNVHSLLEAIQIYNQELFIQDVLKGSPAYEAGVRVGDRIIAADGRKVYSFEHLRNVIQDVGEKSSKALKEAGQKDAEIGKVLKIQMERLGQMQEVTAAIKSTKGKDPLGQTIVTYTIGILSSGKPKMPAGIILERTFNPFKALWIGLSETADNTVVTVVGLKKLAFGEVSAKSMGGPIMIGKMAGETFSTRGFRDFLRIMAIISISLGVFNLLPVPILDGGHIVFAVLEAARGKPVSQKAQQVALKVGLSLILVLMVFTFYNDISRIIPLPF